MYVGLACFGGLGDLALLVVVYVMRSVDPICGLAKTNVSPTPMSERC